MDEKELAILNATARIVSAILTSNDATVFGSEHKSLRVLRVEKEEGKLLIPVLDLSLAELVNEVKQTLLRSFE